MSPPNYSVLSFLVALKPFFVHIIPNHTTELSPDFHLDEGGERRRFESDVIGVENGGGEGTENRRDLNE